ncbi:ACT domain-containing protein [Hyphococcus sp. DH-69]|uniref:ACT domain-containing protein n=1 Tax=Hyphococcus formosus TaxID=3143534 RepID=UPI00398B5751
MQGEKNLDTLLRSLTATLKDGTYVFVTLPDNDIPAGINPRMIFRESEGKTLILTKEEAEKAALDYSFPCRMITLNVHSALEAVGFIAHIATKLAQHGMGVNPVAGFYHDHLFVPLGRENDALKILEEIAKDAQK